MAISRRKTVALTAIAATAILGLGFDWPWPNRTETRNLVKELRSCFEALPSQPIEEPANPVKRQRLEFECVVAQLLPAKAGASVFDFASFSDKPFFGIVKDQTRAQTLIKQLYERDCLRKGGVDGPDITLDERSIGFVRPGLHINYTSNGGLVKLRGPTELLMKSTTCKGGDVQLLLEFGINDPKTVGQDYPVKDGAIQINNSVVANYKWCTRLKEGETCCIGGTKVNFESWETAGVPLLKRIPRIGSSFTWDRQVDIDSELIILLKLKRISNVAED